jgi:hypothetical protein
MYPDGISCVYIRTKLDTFEYFRIKEVENCTTLFHNFSYALPKIGEMSNYYMILGNKISGMSNYQYFMQ